LLNVAGYYDGLTTFLDHAVAEQFVKPPHRGILLVEQQPDALLDRFASYQAPSTHKWVEREQT
jgi:predicted Rossmann-fold nucleotide-binding protein